MFVLGLLFLLQILLIPLSVLVFNNNWVFLTMPLFFLLVPFVDTPSGKMSGTLFYYSPLFIVSKQKKGVYQLHGGTLFDYFFIFKWKDRGLKSKKVVFIHLLDGLLNLIEELKSTEDAVTIKGASYFFNEKTAQSINFTTHPAPAFHKIMMGIHYLAIAISYSFTTGKFALPPLGNLIEMESDKHNLIQQEPVIRRLKNRLIKAESI